MTKSASKEDAESRGEYLAIFADELGTKAAADLLKKAARIHLHTKAPLTHYEASQQLTNLYLAAGNRLVLSFLATVQSGVSLIATTGVLSEHGIDWKTWDRQKMFDTADKISDADLDDDDDDNEAQGQGSN